MSNYGSNIQLTPKSNSLETATCRTEQLGIEASRLRMKVDQLRRTIVGGQQPAMPPESVISRTQINDALPIVTRLFDATADLEASICTMEHDLDLLLESAAR